jgi:hypothetical protein
VSVAESAKKLFKTNVANYRGLSAVMTLTVIALPIQSLNDPIELSPQQLGLRATDVLWCHRRGLADEKPVLLVLEDIRFLCCRRRGPIGMGLRRLTAA